MKEWIVSIVAVVLITSIINLILPQGKMGKYIKSIFSILTMLVVIKPIVYLKEGSFELEKYNNFNEIALQNDFLDYIYAKRIEEYEKNCNKIIGDLGVKNASVEIIYEVDDQNLKIDFVQINLKNSVIISDVEHIDIKEGISTDIASYLNITKSKVLIYE